ncbi:hypothetical protein M405DRAFT_417510 [Rhizopogon salebrosus TDB-379]|nr:hypothetical protein M405DRAFT_417510 [Rhizopogon salebrosus TDB-379]
MDVGGKNEDADDLSKESEEDEEDSEEVKALKVGCLVCTCVFQDVAISSCFRSAGIQTAPAPIPFLETCVDVISEHRVLVLDSNVILSSLSAVASIKSLRWTVVIPVPVIMELDSLVKSIKAWRSCPGHHGQLLDVTQRTHREG